MPSAYELTRDELSELLVGEPNYRVEQVWHGLWVDAQSIGEITTIPKALRSRLVQALPASLEVANDVQSDMGATRKWVFRLHDGATIETVLMGYEDRVTVCVSSQAGCAMGCTFCATGQAGFTRHLTSGEVLEQVMFAARAAAPRRLTNVVFMGMGEPLANYLVTMNVVKRLHEYRGLSARHLTVSTVGVAPAIERMAKTGLPLTLAVSLHSANNESRNELVPLNRRYPLERLHEASVLDGHDRSAPQFRVGAH
jgi:23S rRNA (adenine2503-C2)-methyltransferase